MIAHMDGDLARRALSRKTTEVVPRNEERGRRLTKGTRSGSSIPRVPHRPLAFPRTTRSCTPHDRHGSCRLRDRRGAGPPQCLEPAILPKRPRREILSLSCTKQHLLGDRVISATVRAISAIFAPSDDYMARSPGRSRAGTGDDRDFAGELMFRPPFLCTVTPSGGSAS